MWLSHTQASGLTCARTPTRAQRDGALRCEIVAHSRWISALDLHPSRDVFATAAEDASVTVWALPAAGTAGAGGKGAAPAPLASACELHCALTGVAFCGRGGDDVAAAAYDMEQMPVWRGLAARAGGGA